MACASYSDVSSIGKTRSVLSSARPTGADLYIGQLIFETDTKRLLVHDGTGWIILREPWQSYATTLTQGVGVTYVTAVSEYQRRNGMCFWRGRIAATSAGTSGQPVLATLPAGGSTEIGVPVGSGLIFDLSAAQRYVSTVEAGSSADKMGWGPDGTSTFWGSAPSIALASGDILTWAVEFKMASAYS